MAAHKLGDPIVINETATKYYCKCLTCGKEFSDYKSNRNYQPPKFCSDKCFRIGSRFKNINLNCEYCGTPIVRDSHHRNKRFCTVQCAIKYRKEHMQRKGWVTDCGYKAFSIDGRTVLEHVMVAEKSLGRKLMRNEVVHHKDFNRLNNSIENLEVMTRGEHSRIHRMYEKESGKKFFGGVCNEH